MRQIKFRAWIDQSDKYSKLRPEMKYFSDKEWPEILMNPGTGALWFAGDDEDVALPIRGVVRLMQYTGIKDCNGKDIYEGDIIQWSIYTGIVRFGDTPKQLEDSWYAPCFWIENIDDGDKNYKLQRYFNNHPSPQTIAVIGNIYENPELKEAK